MGFALTHDLALVLRGVRLLFLPQQVPWEASRIDREIPSQRLGEKRQLDRGDGARVGTEAYYSRRRLRACAEIKRSELLMAG